MGITWRALHGTQRVEGNRQRLGGILGHEFHFCGLLADTLAQD